MAVHSPTNGNQERSGSDKNGFDDDESESIQAVVLTNNRKHCRFEQGTLRKPSRSAGGAWAFCFLFEQRPCPYRIGRSASNSLRRYPFLVMQVQILPFGVLKDWLGSSASTIELEEGATVADLLQRLISDQSLRLFGGTLRGIAVSVNAEYAQSTHRLREGDEVGLLPPVSGGSTRGPNVSDENKSQQPVAIALTCEPIDAEKLEVAAKRGEDGAVVVFDGIVRNNSRGRKTLHLEYEAYQEMALKQMNALAREAIHRFGVRHVTVVHRLGKLEVGETSVLIVVASAHRAQAFDACRWLIDTLKKTVPIWKKETFVDGVVWADGEPFPEGLAASGPEAAHDS